MSEEVTPRKIGILLLVAAGLTFGGAALVNWVKIGDPIPRPTLPVSTPTVVTGTVAPSPLCKDAADSQCWETEREQGGPWTWRDKPRVRMDATDPLVSADLASLLITLYPGERGRDWQVCTIVADAGDAVRCPDGSWWSW